MAALSVPAFSLFGDQVLPRVKNYTYFGVSLRESVSCKGQVAHVSAGEHDTFSNSCSSVGSASSMLATWFTQPLVLQGQLGWHDAETMRLVQAAGL